MKLKRVCLVGIFPPPLHGMSLITDYVRERISVSVFPLVIDCSPRSLNRSFLVRFGKVFRVIRCILYLLAQLLAGYVGTVYIGLSGGKGQFYDLFFAGLSRVFGRNIYLHHHGYQYINQFSWLAWLLFVVSGKKAVHIVACEKMERDLKRLYSTVTEVRIISGIAALEVWDSEIRHREQVQSIGFLSNISIEKGILEFLDVAEKAGHIKLPLHFVLAGPFQDEDVKCLVEKRLSALSNVTWIGPVYGSNKQIFFDSIDVFLMPSHNESEGLVIHESLSRGVPVIAYARGCIEQIISDQVGLKLSPAEDYVTETVAKIEEWFFNPRLFQLASHASLRQFSEARSLNIKKMDALCVEIVG